MLAKLLFVLVLVTLVTAQIEQVHVALTGIVDQMSVMWITRPGFEEEDARYVVEYGYSPGDYKFQEDKIKSSPYTVKYCDNSPQNYQATAHEAVLTGLKTGTTVYYIVTDGTDRTKEFSFPTSFKVGQKSPQYKFLTYGDMDINGDSRETLALAKKQLQTDKDIRFIIHQGDIPYAWNCDEPKWDRWGNMAEHITANMPYMTTVGNHEENANFTSYRNRFTNTTGHNSESKQDGNLYYSFDYGSVHFVGLSSEHNFVKKSPQYKWLQNDLKNVDRTKTPFVILYAHRPMYSSNQNHGSSIQFREALEPLLSKYKVDIFLFGHVHAYERSCPITQNEKCEKSHHSNYYNNPTGTIHLVVGTAGYESNPHWDPKPDWSVYRETSHGLMKFTVLDNTALYGQYIRNDGKIADQFMIDKKPK